MHKPVLLSLTLAAAVTALAWSPAPTVPEPLGGDACRRAAEADAKVAAVGSRELFFAVLEGLYADGASNAAVDAVLALDPASGRPANFVPGCPICSPAYEAFRAYRARPAFEALKHGFGNGLDAESERALVHGTADERFERAGKLVQGWIARRLDEQRLTDDERAAWTRAMDGWRQKGMAMLDVQRASERPGIFAGRKTCSMCDAANEACKSR
ncbi:MAG: hypothetical protein IT453_00720 [Planctomycetes bacterium]|nr:hypothetical protein [Planctomycetota bacterium]